MKNIILKLIVLMILICIIILIIIQYRKEYNISNLLIDTTDLLENFNTSVQESNLLEETNSSNIIPNNNDEISYLASKLNILENSYNIDKINIQNDRELLNKIKDKINSLAKATGNSEL